MTTVSLSITNPGAEDGTNGWTTSQGSLIERSHDPSPYEGAAYFSGGTSTETRAYQDVSLPEHAAIDDGRAEIILEWQQASHPTQEDAAEMRYQFLDEGGGSVGGEVGLGLEAPGFSWKKRSYRFDVPQGARSIRLWMRMVKSTGTQNDGHIDSIIATLEAVPSDEEVFRASFEDASGRDPLATALIERTPARRLANHNVIVYKYPPYWVTMTLPVPLEKQQDLTLPGLDMWLKNDNSPLFKMGRWAQIEGREFNDDPKWVTLDLRISDHPESFIPPE